MKLLQRMLLINWHYVWIENIDFAYINFLTGKNGAGKSTIIDALQLIMLGDTNGFFFNKSASDSSKRTLKGYLMGELSDDGGSGFRYLREGKDFSSYIAAEFYDTDKKKYITLGAVFDVTSGGDYEHKFFILRSPIPENNFTLDDKPRSIKNLRSFFKNNYNGKFEFPESNKSYQSALLGELGGVNSKFFSLFKKSVQFTPIADIEKFISEFVCDVKAKVDIEDMQDNIRYYKQLQYDSESIKTRIEKLEEIDEGYRAYKVEADRLIEQNYLVDRSKVQVAEENISRLKERLERVIAEAEDCREKLKLKNGEKEHLKEQSEELKREKYNSDVYKKSEELLRLKRELEKQLKEMEDIRYKLQRKLQSYGIQWRTNVEEVTGFEGLSLENMETLARELLNGAKSLIEVKDDNIFEITREKLSYLEGSMKEYLDRINNLYFGIRDELEEVEKSISDIKVEIENLKRGIKPYDENILLLRQEIEKRLSIHVDILSDVIDVVDEKWHNVIEGYLHSQKFHLIVEPKYYIAALKIYEEMVGKNKLYGVGLVDIEKLLKKDPRIHEGSLAEEVRTENPYARAYIDYLLGRVIKCKSVEELNKYEISITPGGMLYQNYTARQLNPERWRTPYIGKASIERLIEIKGKELVSLEANKTLLDNKFTFLGKARKIDSLTQNDIDSIEADMKKIEPYEEKNQEKHRVTLELGKLDMTYLAKVDEKIRQVEVRINDIENEILTLSGDIREKDNEARDTKNVKLPGAEREREAAVLNMAQSYISTWVEEIGEPRFLREFNERKSAKNIIENFSVAAAGTLTRRNTKFNALVNLRANYNRDYKMSFDIGSEANDAFVRELRDLKDTKLAQYEEKIKDAADKAQKQFQEDFISKLKQNIDTVRTQINEMNDALKDINFGRDKYRFEVKPNQGYRKFYDMITDSMLMEGFNLFSMDFQSKHRDAIDELFKQIVDVGEGNLTADQRSELEKNIEKYTDYRTYLSFDLIVTNESGIESRLSKVMSKKSGGETQTPFYISVLAAFQQRYRMRSKDNNTLRLIVFDEAFNKMDHERIQESIKLLKSLGFQAIISAPTEKIGDIAPFVDRNLCVTRIKDKTLVRAFDHK